MLRSLLGLLLSLALGADLAAQVGPQVNGPLQPASPDGIAGSGFRLRTLNLNVACREFLRDYRLNADWLAYRDRESWNGLTDLNGDGDVSDAVLFVRNLHTGEVYDSGFDARWIELDGDYVATQFSEEELGFDVNNNGVMTDWLLFRVDLTTGITTNLGLSMGIGVAFENGVLLMGVFESTAFPPTDFNGDGDTSDTVLHAIDIASGVVTNLAVTYGQVEAGSAAAGIGVREVSMGDDLNGDGDQVDDVVHVYDYASSTLTNLGLAYQEFYELLEVEGGQAAFVAPEADNGVDLNGDSDLNDVMVYHYDVASATLTDLGPGMFFLYLEEDHLYYPVSEFFVGDLNGDSDTDDAFLFYYDVLADQSTNLGVQGEVEGIDGELAGITVREIDTDLDGDGDTSDWVAHVYDASTGTLTNLETVVNRILEPVGNKVAFNGWEAASGRDLNGDGQISGTVLGIYDATDGSIRYSRFSVQGTESIVLDDPHGFLLPTSEFTVGLDLNGDGDQIDTVVLAHDFATGLQRSTGVTALFGSAEEAIKFEGRFGAFLVEENDIDLNSDGDLTDEILHLVELRDF